jgi:hypothetical protein
VETRLLILGHPSNQQYNRLNNYLNKIKVNYLDCANDNSEHSNRLKNSVQTNLATTTVICMMSGFNFERVVFSESFCESKKCIDILLTKPTEFEEINTTVKV